jgi:GntR family transcriptional regulator/MocR family aminotransferase
VNRLRRIYSRRRDAIVDMLTAQLGHAITFTVPSGGMAIWAKADTDVDAWAMSALAHGVSFHTGRRYTFDAKPAPYLRLSFASLSEEHLDSAIGRMTSALPSFARTPRARWPKPLSKPHPASRH